MIIQFIKGKGVILFFIVLLIGGSFIHGFLAGAFRLFPHNEIRVLKQAIFPKGGGVDRAIREAIEPSIGARYSAETPVNEWLRYTFTQPILNSEALLYPPALNFQEIEKLSISDGVRQFPPSTFFYAYNDISDLVPHMHNVKVDGAEAIVARMEFVLKDQKAFGYSYVVPSTTNSTNCGVLFIPGSEVNQSTAALLGKGIYYGDSIERLKKYCDVLILIKPNEDIRAIHDGTMKLGPRSLYLGSLVQGGSYSVRYLIEALAFAKWQNQKYNKVAIVGLSQGGMATFLTSLQANPDLAVVASGLSMANWYDYILSVDQILIPNLTKVYSREFIQKRLKMNKTSYVLSYGAFETFKYGFEAQSKYTCNFFSEIIPDRTVCSIFNGGHVFDLDLLEHHISSLHGGRLLDK